MGSEEKNQNLASSPSSAQVGVELSLEERLNDSIHKNFNGCLGNVVSQIAKTQINCNNSELKEVIPSYMYNEWLAGILVSSPDFRSIIKIHFNHPSIAQLKPGSAQVKSAATIDDLMKEFCNQVGGAIKSIFEQIKVASGISLPFVTAGFDEFFFSEVRRKATWITSWNMEQNGKIIFSLTHETEILNLELLKVLAQLDSKMTAVNLNSSNDDMELL